MPESPTPLDVGERTLSSVHEQEQLGKTTNGQPQEPTPSRDASLPWTLSGDGFEAVVAMRTLERVLAVLESGEQIGFGWPMLGTKAGHTDRLFARFRAIRDDLVELRKLRRPRDTRPDGDMGSSR